MLPITCQFSSGGGGTHLNGGTGMCGPQDLLFTPLLQFTRPPSSGTSPFTRPFFERNMCQFPSKTSIFFRKYYNFHLKKLKFDCNFCQYLEFFFFKISVLKLLFLLKSAHKPPFSRQFIHSQAPPPKFGNPSRTIPTRKKVECLPSGSEQYLFPHVCIIDWSHLVNN